VAFQPDGLILRIAEAVETAGKQVRKSALL
jgi:hypothetical protein